MQKVSVKLALFKQMFYMVHMLVYLMNILPGDF